MKRGKSQMEDELRSEYDLKSLQVRRLGSGRKSFGGTTVRLEPDVAQMFPSADAVSQQPHPQGDAACDSISHSWADHNRRIDWRPTLKKVLTNIDRSI